MNPEVKTEWLTALRSGNYRQATGYLRRLKPYKTSQPEGFCCLGVVCDIYHKTTGNGRWQDPHEYGSALVIGGEFIPDKTDLPPAVREWSGLTDDETRCFLAEKNDGDWTFEAIANWIEENL